MFISDMIFKRLISALWRRQRQRERLDEVAVDAEADAQPIVERLDVDVGAAVTQRLADDLADELHHGRLVVEVDLGDGLGNQTLIVLGGEGGDDVVDVGGRAVHLLDERGDGLLVGCLPGEALTRGRFDLLSPRCRRIGGVQHDQAVFLTDRHHLVDAGDLLGEAGDDLLVEFHDRDVGDRYLADRSDGRRQLDTADAMTIQERCAELEQVAVGVSQCPGKRLGIELPALDERLADRGALVR